MSTSVSPPKPARSGNGSRRRFRRLVVILSAILVCGVLFVLIRTQGAVSGEEFSPTHFQTRSFSFYEIPLLHLQITPIHRKGTTPPTARYVRQTGLIPAASGDPAPWHKVRISRGLTGSTPADAELLIDQLQLQRQGKEYWHEWSKDHPARAKILWNTIAKLARRELYLMMPSLFEQAQQAESPQALQKAIDQQLKSQYAGLVRDMQDAGRRSLAESFLQEALADYPDDPVLQQLHADLQTDP